MLYILTFRRTSIALMYSEFTFETFVPFIARRSVYVSVREHLLRSCACCVFPGSQNEASSKSSSCHIGKQKHSNHKAKAIKHNVRFLAAKYAIVLHLFGSNRIGLKQRVALNSRVILQGMRSACEICPISTNPYTSLENLLGKTCCSY